MPSSAQDIQGVWVGQYICGQGVTGLTLTITGGNPQQLTARFRTHPLPQNPRAPESEFELAGSFNPAARQIELRPTRWIQQPPGYSMVGLRGVLQADGQRLQGNIVFGGCSVFALTRSSNAPPQTRAQTQPPLVPDSGSMNLPASSPSRQSLRNQSVAVFAAFYDKAQTPSAQCQLILSWLSKIRKEYPTIDLRGNMLTAIPFVMNDYRDEEFVPIFGVPFDQTSDADRIKFHQEVIRKCYRPLPDGGNFSQQIQDYQWVLDQPFLAWAGPGLQLFTNVIVQRRTQAESLKRSTDEVRALPPTEEGFDKLEQYRSTAKSEFGPLWPSELAKYEALIAERRPVLAKGMIATWLSEIGALNDSVENFGKIADKMKSTARKLASLDPADKLSVHRGASAKMSTMLVAFEQNPASIEPKPGFLTDLKALNVLVSTSDDDVVRTTRERINRVIDILVKKKLAEMNNFAATPDGYGSYTKWETDFRRDFDAFSNFTSVQSANTALSEKFAALGAEVAAGIKAGLSGSPGINELTRGRASITQMEKVSRSDALTKPLWEDYEAAVTAYMKKFIDAAPSAVKPEEPGWFGRLFGSGAPKEPPKPKPNVFTTSDLSEAFFLDDIYRHDFLATQNADVDRMTFYLALFVGGMNRICPGTVPQSVTEILKNMMQQYNQPSNVMRQTLNAQAVLDRAKADVIRLKNKLDCADPIWKTFFANLEAWYKDPTEGVAPDKVSLARLCSRKLSTTFCSCASPVMERTLNETQLKFVRLDAFENMKTARNLLPKLDAGLNVCRN